MDRIGHDDLWVEERDVRRLRVQRDHPGVRRAAGQKQVDNDAVPSRSAAETFVITSTAAFEGPLGENPFLTVVVSPTVTLMMLPGPRSTIRGANARVIKNTPLMLVSITSRHAAGSFCQNGRFSRHPVQATSGVRRDPGERRKMGTGQSGPG